MPLRHTLMGPPLAALGKREKRFEGMQKIVTFAVALSVRYREKP